MHAHHHGHSHASGTRSRAFALGMALNLAFILFEVVFGLRARSLALLADAGHNLSDVLGLGLAWGALVLAQQPPSERHTYGMRRASILAALANAILLLVAVGGIAWEALHRLRAPHAVAGDTVMAVAAAGVVINGVTALLFLSGRKEDLNVRGAFLHMAADAGVSLGVVLATLAERTSGWLWIDPATGIAIALVILYSTWGLGRDSVDLAFDAAPSGIDPDAVKRHLEGLPGVIEVHDLHIWAMSTTETALTAHLVRPGANLDDAFIADAARDLAKRFSIRHATLQVECGDPAHPCRLAPAEVV